MSGSSSQAQQPANVMNTGLTDALRMALAQAAVDGPALSLPATQASSNASVATTDIDWNEERIDPDRKVWSFHEYHAAHIGAYNFQDIVDYWRSECKPFALENGQKVCSPAAKEGNSEAEFAKALYAQLAIEQDAAKQEVADRQRVLDDLGESLGVGSPSPAQQQQEALQVQQALVHHLEALQVQQALVNQAASSGVGEIQQAASQQAAIQEQASFEQPAIQEVQQAILQQAAIQHAALQHAALLPLALQRGAEPDAPEEALKQAAAVRLMLERSLLGGDDADDDEFRQDPDGKIWRYSDYREAHIGEYNLVDIRDYWRIECSVAPCTEVERNELLTSQAKVALPSQNPGDEAACSNGVPDDKTDSQREAPSSEDASQSIADDLQNLGNDILVQAKANTNAARSLLNSTGFDQDADFCVAEDAHEDQNKTAEEIEPEQKADADFHVAEDAHEDQNKAAEEIEPEEKEKAVGATLKEGCDSDEENNRNASNSPRRPDQGRVKNRSSPRRIARNTNLKETNVTESTNESRSQSLTLLA